MCTQVSVLRQELPVCSNFEQKTNLLSVQPPINKTTNMPAKGSLSEAKSMASVFLQTGSTQRCRLSSLLVYRGFYGRLGMPIRPSLLVYYEIAAQCSTKNCFLNTTKKSDEYKPIALCILSFVFPSFVRKSKNLYQQPYRFF